MAMHSHSRSSPLSVCVSRGKVTVEEMVLDDEQETGGQTSTRVRERMIEKGEMKLKKKHFPFNSTIGWSCLSSVATHNYVTPVIIIFWRFSMANLQMI